MFALDAVVLPYFVVVGLDQLVTFPCWIQQGATQLGIHVGLCVLDLRMIALLFEFEIQKNILEAERVRDAVRLRATTGVGGVGVSEDKQLEQEAALLNSASVGLSSDTVKPIGPAAATTMNTPRLTEWRESWYVLVFSFCCFLCCLL